MDAISPGAPVIPLAPSTGAVAFEALWAEHAPRAMRLAGLLCGRREAAEDLVADAFVRVLPRWRDGAVDEFWPYLRTALVNRHRSSHRREVVADRWIQTRRVEPTGPDTAKRLADRTALAEALAQLTATQRKVLVLRYFEDLSEADTAAIVGCGVGTVKSSASRGLARLRELMEGNDDV